MSLAGKVHHGVKWCAFQVACIRCTRFLATIVLARILAPEVFGVVAMAQVCITLLNTLRDLGLGQGYIQRQGLEPQRDQTLADTTFWLTLIINTLCMGLAWAAAPWIAGFFQSAGLLPVLRAMVGLFLLEGLGAVPLLVLQKRLQFKERALCEMLQGAGYALLSITLALAGFGVWSLVAGHLGGYALYTTAGYLLSGWRPRATFDAGDARDLFRYGRSLWGFGILSAAGDAFDKILVGRFLGAASLGFYGMAFNLSSLPARQIGFLVNRLTFPVFSELQQDRNRLRSAFLKALSHIAVVTLPLTLGLHAVAAPLVHTVYGARWAPIIPLLQVLSIYGGILSLSSITAPVFKALGRPHILLALSIPHHLLQAALLIVLLPHGLIGICAALLPPATLTTFVSFFLAGRLLHCSLADLLNPVLRPLICALVMLLTVRGLLASPALAPLLPADHPATLLFAISIGASVYLGTSICLNRTILFELRSTLEDVLLSSPQKARATP